MPKLSSSEFEELFELYKTAKTKPGITPKESRRLITELRARLGNIWDAIDPKPLQPFPMVFEDFRRSVVDQFSDRLRKEDPRFRRPRS
jgi:hypothetical protein